MNNMYLKDLHYLDLITQLYQTILQLVYIFFKIHKHMLGYELLIRLKGSILLLKHSNQLLI